MGDLSQTRQSGGRHMKALYWGTRIAVVLCVITFGASTAAQQLEFTEPIYKDAVRDTTAAQAAPATGANETANEQSKVTQAPSTTGKKTLIVLATLAVLGLIIGVILTVLKRRGGNAHGNHDEHDDGAHGHGTQPGNHGHATPPATPPAGAGGHDHTRPARPAREDHAAVPAGTAAPAAAPATVNPADAIARAARTPAPAATPATPPAGGGMGTTTTGILLFLLALPALGMAQMVTPADIVAGYPARDYKIAPASNCTPSEVYVQNGVRVSNVARTGDAIAFRAEAISGATLGPTRVHVKCQGGTVMNAIP